MLRSISDIIELHKDKVNSEVMKYLMEMLLLYEKEVVSETLQEFSFIEREVAKEVFKNHKDSTAYKVKDVAENCGTSKSIVIGVMEKLQVAKIIIRQSRGCSGCFAKIINRKFLEILDGF